MIDLNAHTRFSDGTLLPGEMAVEAAARGYNSLVLADHVDWTNMSWLLENLVQGVKQMAPFCRLNLFVGAELTRIPPPLFPDLTQKARSLGAELVIAHGESITKTVERGTNLAAIESGVDILGHPGLITDQEASLAAERGVCVELTPRGGHCLTNGHLTAMARKHGFRLVINSNAHAADDLISSQHLENIGRGAGLSTDELALAQQNSREIVQKLLRG